MSENTNGDGIVRIIDCIKQNQRFYTIFFIRLKSLYGMYLKGMSTKVGVETTERR